MHSTMENDRADIVMDAQMSLAQHIVVFEYSVSM